MRKDSQATIDLILAHLPGTCLSVAQATGRQTKQIWRWLTRYDGEFWYLHRWVLSPHGGPYAGYYKAGPKPRPNYVPSKQKIRPSSKNTKAYRKRQKESGEIIDVRAKERARYWLKKKPKPHPLMSMYAPTQE